MFFCAEHQGFESGALMLFHKHTLQCMLMTAYSAGYRRAGGNQKMTDRNNLDQKRWLVLIASCLINLCIGSIYAWSVFASPMAQRLTELSANGQTYSASTLAIVFTVANSVGPVTMISGGYFNDKLGPKWVIFVGGLLFGGGMLLSGFATGIPMLIIGYGLGCGLGMGMAYGCTINNSVKFFPDKKGLIGGIATATYGLSSVLIPPVANKMIAAVGVSSTFRILGIVFIAVICLFSMFIVKCPEGYAPGAETAGKTGGAGSAGPESAGQKAALSEAAASGQNKNWKGMLANPLFYIMIVMLMCGAFSGLMITSQASPMAQSMAGMSVAAAGVAVSVLALFNAAGRVAAGFLSDLLGRVNVLLCAFALEIIGLICLLNISEGRSALFLIGVSLMGICFGALMGVYPGFTADQFGTKNNSVNYGIMFIGFALAGIGGPTMVGRILSATGAYTGAFLAAIALAVVGIILSLLYKRISRRASV